MAGPFRASFLLPAIAALSMVGAGQVVQPPQSVPAQSVAAPITLGQSAVPLNGPWKFQIGDSPVNPVTNAPLWAEPGYDDSKWETIDLAPKAGEENIDILGRPSNGGWSAHGHAGYLGWAWYRMKVPVAGSPRQPLAVAELSFVNDPFQFFADGSLVGSFGHFDGSKRPPKGYFSQSSMFPLPQVAASDFGARVTTRTLAFRVWGGPLGFLRVPGGSGLLRGPILGEPDAVASLAELDSFRFMRLNAYPPFQMLLLFLLAVLALGQTLFDRSDPVYRWVASMLVITGLYDVTSLLSNARILDFASRLLIDDVLLDPLLLGGWAMVWWIWFRFRQPVWVPWAIGAMTLAHAAAAILEDSYMIRDTTSIASQPLFQGVSTVVRLLCIALLFFIVALGIRRHGREGWIVLPSALLIAPQQFTVELPHVGIPTLWLPFGVLIFIGYVANLFLAGAIALLLFRRLLLSIRRQRQMALDVKQAHEVQQVLIPQAIPEVSGFNIGSVYLPAGEVGGDFFQIIKTPQGGVLLCIGDVSGKGLPAAMTVSLLVGTFRTLAHYSESPSAILEAMNTRMLGRSRGGFTTCLVLRADQNGALTVANAGHIAPYAQGKEIQIENGLPLGLDAAAEYPETNIRLELAEQLTLVTDGVVEARSASGELLGFDRTSAMAADSAETIANSAKKFGQEDDITVLTLTRTQAGEESMSYLDLPPPLPKPT